MGDFGDGPRRITEGGIQVDCYTYVSRKLGIDRAQVKHSLNLLWAGEDIPNVLKSTKLKSSQIAYLYRTVDEWVSES